MWLPHSHDQKTSFRAFRHFDVNPTMTLRSQILFQFSFHMVMRDLWMPMVHSNVWVMPLPI
jgi:hypothetical protein